jgi:hypothetical protein
MAQVVLSSGFKKGEAEAFIRGVSTAGYVSTLIVVRKEKIDANYLTAFHSFDTPPSGHCQTRNIV